MNELITTPNLTQGDDFYAELLSAHGDLSLEQSHELNAKLVLLLSNHVGRLAVLREALAAARDSVLDCAGTPPPDQPNPVAY